VQDIYKHVMVDFIFIPTVCIKYIELNFIGMIEFNLESLGENIGYKDSILLQQFSV
jgi:hypothetical protein